MTRINGLNIKATTPDLKNLEDVDLQSGDVQTEEVQNTETQDTGSSEVQARIEEANAELSRVLEEYDEFLSDEQRSEIERLLATLRAESAAIDGAGYGVGYNPETGAIEAVNYASRTSLPEMGSGWNGGIISTYPEDANRLGAEDGEYMGTIEIEASGDPTNPTALMFSVDDAFEAEVTGGGSIDNVDVRSQGRDLVVTISGTDGSGNEITKSWVVREGTVRPEPMVFNFTQLGHEIHFDASRAYRISDGSYNSYYGVSHRFYIHGTAFNDTIYGSQGDDKIVGWEGDDTIDAMAGNDTVWGDEQYDVGGSYGPDGGRDTIRGGAGNDTLYGGGNIDTRYASDSVGAGSPGGVNEFERIVNDTNVAIPDTSSWIDAPGWETVTDGNGAVTLRNTGDATNNQLEITLPDGYTMAFGEVAQDGMSLLITFVGEDSQGNPQTFRLTIDDFMRGLSGHSVDDILHLTINGSNESDIIDFSKIQNLESQVININGHAGDDMLLAPPSERMAQGLSREDLLSSTDALTELDRGQLILDENEDGYFDAEIDETNRRFTITLNDDNPIPDGVEPTLTLVAPEGYTTGYLSRDPDPDNGNLLYIMVNPDTKDTIVVEIADSTGLDFSEVLIVNKKIENLEDAINDGKLDADATTNPWVLIPISLDVNDYTVDGGTGSDLIFAPRGTNFIVDSEDEVIEGNFDDGNGLDNVPPSG